MDNEQSPMNTNSKNLYIKELFDYLICFFVLSNTVLFLFLATFTFVSAIEHEKQQIEFLGVYI